MKEEVRYAVGCDATVDKLMEIAREQGRKEGARTMTEEAVKIRDMEQPETTDAMALIDKTAALFAFKHPALIGPALADLMATWLSGHIVLDGDAKEDAKETKKMRHTVLDIQMRAVWQLVALKDADRKARGEKPQ